MKIAVWHNLPSGGGKRALYYHVRGLLERGHSIEAWCPPSADRSYLPLAELIPENVVPLDRENGNVDGKRRWRIPGPYHHVLRSLRALDLHCSACAAQIQRGSFDLLFANSCIYSRTSSIARHLHLPSLLYLQEPYRWLYEAIPRLPWVALPARSRWTVNYLRQSLLDVLGVHALRVQAREEVESAKTFDQIVVNSLFSRESVMRAYGVETKVCYLGVDTDLFRPAGAPKEGYVVGMGGIAPTKGLERAVRAVATIPLNKRPDLVWIGNFSDRAYQQRVEALAAALCVRFIAKTAVSDGDVVSLLSRATVMLYTSLLEPFGFAPLEANACGTPVVAVAEGGVRETVLPGLNGLLVSDAEPVALGEALLTFLDSPEKAVSVGKQARQHVIDNWGWQKAIDQLECHLKEVLTPTDVPGAK